MNRVDEAGDPVGSRLGFTHAAVLRWEVGRPFAHVEVLLVERRMRDHMIAAGGNRAIGNRGKVVGQEGGRRRWQEARIRSGQLSEGHALERPGWLAPSPSVPERGEFRLDDLVDDLAAGDQVVDVGLDDQLQRAVRDLRCGGWGGGAR